jgi:hypothetical protein
MNKPKWIRFEFNGLSDSGKTKRWLVIEIAEPQAVLGTITWYSSWRCYAYSPKPDRVTVYEKYCLRDIANFCEQATVEHKRALDAAKQEKVPVEIEVIRDGKRFVATYSRLGDAGHFVYTAYPNETIRVSRTALRNYEVTHEPIIVTVTKPANIVSG